MTQDRAVNVYTCHTPCILRARVVRRHEPIDRFVRCQVALDEAGLPVNLVEERHVFGHLQQEDFRVISWL